MIKWSKNRGNSEYTAKLGYKAKMEKEMERETSWWWPVVWKLENPLKAKIFMWLALENKILTWDNCQKRNMQGPRRCNLCKNNEESLDHLFVNCPFTREVWKKLLLINSGKNRWEQRSLIDCFHSWTLDSRQSCKGSQGSSLFCDSGIVVISKQNGFSRLKIKSCSNCP
jgi:hypothetical protein